MLSIKRDADERGACLVTLRAFDKGEIVGRFSGYTVVSVPDRYSVQIGVNRHIADIGPFSYLNHSCDPSTSIDTEALTLIATRDLAAGDELSFFYPTTEWEMSEPFLCRCGAAQCLGWIAGAKHLDPALLGRYTLSPHVAELLGQRAAEESSDALVGLGRSASPRFGAASDGM